MPLFGNHKTNDTPTRLNSAPNTLAFNPRDAHVLIVDDSSNDVELATRALAKLGIKHWHSVNSAERAMVELSRKTYQAALVDINLPGLGGIDLLKAMTKAYPATRVIIVTGARDEGIAVQAMKAGAADYVSKDDYLTPAIITSISAALSSINQEKATTLRAGAAIDVALAETDYLLGSARISRDIANTPSLMSDDVFWNGALRLAVEYLQAFFASYPHRPYAQEERFLASLFDRGASPRDLVLLHLKALETLDKASGTKIVLPINPTVILAILLQGYVEAWQQAVSLQSIQAQFDSMVRSGYGDHEGEHQMRRAA